MHLQGRPAPEVDLALPQEISRMQQQPLGAFRAPAMPSARSKLAEIQLVIRSETAEVKHFEDAANTGENAAQIEDALLHVKSDLEASTNLAQQRQSIEIDAEQQLRTEKDKLNRFESQLDELAEKIGSL